MNLVRYEAQTILDHAVDYLIRLYPGAVPPLPVKQADREARVAVRILQALREIVTWCDLATL